MLAIFKNLCYYLIAIAESVVIYTYILPKILGFCNRKFKQFAAVVKLADALDSKSSGLIPRIGSTPISGTK